MKRTRFLEPTEIKAMPKNEDVLSKGQALMKMFPEEKQVYDVPVE